MAADSGGGHDSGTVVADCRPSLGEFLRQNKLGRFAAAFEADGVDLEMFVLMHRDEMKRFAKSPEDQARLAQASRLAGEVYPELVLSDQVRTNVP